jgi:hypothetical protein
MPASVPQFRRECPRQGSDPRQSRVPQGLELSKDLFDRVEIGRVARQEEQLGAGAADQFTDCLALMAAEIIHDDNVTGAEGGDQELFDVSAEAGAVDRPVDDAGAS